MNATIEVQDAEVTAAFAKMVAAGSNPRPYLAAIGAALASSTQLRFRESRAPDGSTWRALSPVTIAHRRKGSAKPLLDTGRLANSMHYSVDGNSVTIGTDVIYARLQQQGAKQGEFGRTKRNGPIPWGNVPGRPFLGLSSDDRAGVLDILAQHLVP